jgi:hypothetical protein
MPLTQLKIKDNAVHAGHSQQLVLLKECGLSRLALSIHSLNNNLLIVIMETVDAMVAGWTLLLNILRLLNL